MKSTRLILIVLAILFVLFFVPGKVNAEEDDTVSIKFNDTNLFNAVLEQTSKDYARYDSNTNEIFYTKEKLDNITFLDLTGKNITDISGLGGFTSLKNLFLSNNNISDLSPISDSITLSALRLSNNRIVNVAYLINLENLTELYLNDNEVEDALPLGYIRNLKRIVFKE